jgi:hypothetical protein
MNPTWNTVRIDGPITPERATEIADLAVAVARETSGIELDYSPRSLLAVDQIVESLRTVPDGGERPADALICLGCYAGEVLARELDGSWAPNHGSPLVGMTDSPLVLALAGGTLNPLGKVAKCYEYGEGDSVFALYHAVAFMPPFGR